MSYLLTNGRVVDPQLGLDAVLDVRLEHRYIAEIGPGLPPSRGEEVIDLNGLVVMPGLIDSHVHLSGAYVGRDLHRGHRMLAKAGVTSAVDFAADGAELKSRSTEHGAGLSIGFLVPAVPDRTLAATATAADVAAFVDRSLADGAMGVKLLGGHYPLTPETMDRIIAAGTERGAYVAVHAGSTATGSNVEGLVEAIDIAAGRPIHLAHINSYCRGQIDGDVMGECVAALGALKDASGICSESYLSPNNGCSAEFVDDEPRSDVLRACLKRGGYLPSRAEMVRAIQDGWALIHGRDGGETTLLRGEDGVVAFLDTDSDIGVSFPVNDPLATAMCALARRDDGAFLVDALSTDGGGVPRNTLVEQGLGIVASGMLSLGDFVMKASGNPARMLGWTDKGTMRPGADGDITVVDLRRRSPEMAFALGQMVMRRGTVLGSGMNLMSLEHRSTAA